MKRLLVVFLILALYSIPASAEIDLSDISTDELYSLRLQINNEIAARTESQCAVSGMTIAELFPDKVLAMAVRDAVGLLSTNDVVTQEQLNTIKSISFLNMNDGLSNLQGIQYLTMLERLSLYFQSDLKQLPDDIGSLQHLKLLSLERCGISELPDSVCNLVNLESLDVSRTGISRLPDDIGNLMHLKELDISETSVGELPLSIHNLNLSTFNRYGLDMN